MQKGLVNRLYRDIHTPDHDKCTFMRAGILPQAANAMEICNLVVARSVDGEICFQATELYWDGKRNMAWPGVKYDIDNIPVSKILFIEFLQTYWRSSNRRVTTRRKDSSPISATDTQGDFRSHVDRGMVWLSGAMFYGMEHTAGRGPGSSTRGTWTSRRLRKEEMDEGRMQSIVGCIGSCKVWERRLLWLTIAMWRTVDTCGSWVGHEQFRSLFIAARHLSDTSRVRMVPGTMSNAVYHSSGSIRSVVRRVGTKNRNGILISKHDWRTRVITVICWTLALTGKQWAQKRLTATTVGGRITLLCEKEFAFLCLPVDRLGIIFAITKHLPLLLHRSTSNSQGIHEYWLSLMV